MCKFDLYVYALCTLQKFVTHNSWKPLKPVDSCDMAAMPRESSTMLVLLLVMLVVPATQARIGEGGARKLDTRKCCLMTQVLVEEGPSQRKCTDKLGQAGLDQMSWQGKQLGEFAIHHGKPHCSGDEKLIPLYHHDNQVQL